MCPSEVDPIPVVLLTRKKRTRNDRRAYPRRPSDERVLMWKGFAGVSDEPLRGWTLNISVGGVRLIINGELSVDDTVDVAVESATCRQGRVVWVSPLIDGCVAGIRFA